MNQKSDELRYECANIECKMELWPFKAVDMNRTPPTLGDLLVCGGCGHFNEVTLSGTKILTKEEFDNLPVDEKKDLEFASRAVVRKLRNN